MRDDSQRRRDEEAIHRLAFYDPLIKLPNRRLLLNRVRHAVAASTRTGHQGAVLLLDLDDFKLLNETHGHSSGDKLLQRVATRLVRCVREADTVACLGGDEFAILLESFSILQSEAATPAETVATKVLHQLDQPYKIGALKHHSTPSIGVVLFVGSQLSVEELLK